MIGEPDPVAPILARCVLAVFGLILLISACAVIGAAAMWCC